MTHQVYISHSAKDKVIADAVCANIEVSEISCWIAPRDVNPGLPYGDSVAEAIENCQIVVLILSRHSDSSNFVFQEIERALNHNKIIIPLRIEYFEPGPKLLSLIKSLHWLDAIDPPIEDAIRKLSSVIASVLKDSQAAGQIEQRPQYEKAPIFQKDKSIIKEGNANKKPYDVFISYRRATDSQTSRLIRSELQYRGFKVFLDVENLRPGHFDEALLERIEEATSFILILSEGSLDNCSNPDDWLRREIDCALTLHKNFIPIMMPGFHFPSSEVLPQELTSLPVHHGINYSHDFFDAMIEKIVDYLSTE